MAQQYQEPKTSDKNTNTNVPRDDKVDKENLKEKQKQEEVAGRHENDGQKGHKGRR